MNANHDQMRVARLRVKRALASLNGEASIEELKEAQRLLHFAAADIDTLVARLRPAGYTGMYR